MELLERELYLDALNSAFASTSRGAGCIALVSGEAGIGKTSLIQQFVAGQGDSVRTLWGGCAALFTPQPLAPLYDMARQVGGNLAASLSAATHRAAMFDATIDYLTRSSVRTIGSDLWSRCVPRRRGYRATQQARQTKLPVSTSLPASRPTRG
jgi:GTPase SAR1 family protein